MRGFLTAITTTVLFAAITNAAWADPQEKVLHNFNNVSGEGYNPYAALTFDDSGNLYGTTLNNGTYNGCGPVFELMPEPGGGWKEKLHFTNSIANMGRQTGTVLTAASSSTARETYGEQPPTVATTGVGRADVEWCLG